MATEREFTYADVKAWRAGGWIFVSLAGELVLRRYTRDRRFTHAEVVFWEGRSPACPKNSGTFSRVELRGDWRGGNRRSRNGITVPIKIKENTNGQ